MIQLTQTLEKLDSPTLEDPGGPYLFIDLYPFDFDDPRTTKVLEDPPWENLIKYDQIRGVWLKASDGTAYGWTSWFVKNFQRLVQLIGDRRGKDFLLGSYHYLQFLQSGVAQADFYVKTLFNAGYSAIDLIPCMDIEFGNEKASNRKASNQQIIDCASTFALRVKQLTGRRVMLYGRGLMRDRSISSKMMADCVANPAYTERMVTNGLVGTLPDGTKAPWELDDLVLWQYCGDGTGDNDVHKLPLSVGGHGIDLSVAIEGARRPTLQSTIKRLT
jgi:hypothetical protein